MLQTYFAAFCARSARTLLRRVFHRKASQLPGRVALGIDKNFLAHKARLFGNHTVVVCGTNGKTTTTHLIRSILLQAGYRVGLIGTIHVLIDDQVRPVRNTTPDVVELQEILADMAAAGINYVVMEVSSHALELERVAGCEFDVAVFTNLTQDHLDFHGTLDQ